MRNHQQTFYELSDKIQEELGSQVMLGKPQGLPKDVKQAQFHAAYARSVADTYLRYVFRKIAKCADDGSEISSEKLAVILKSGIGELDERIVLPSEIRDLALGITQNSVLNYASSHNVLFSIRGKKYEFKYNGDCISFL